MEKKRLTRDQKEALKAYEFASAQQERFLGSVFVTPTGQRTHEAKVKQAYDRCKALGLNYEQGL